MRLYRAEDEARMRAIRAQEEATRAREVGAQLTIKNHGGSSEGEQHYRWSALVSNRAPQGLTNVQVLALIDGVSHIAKGPEVVAQGDVNVQFSVSVFRTQGEPSPEVWAIEYEAADIGRWNHDDKGRLYGLDR